MKNPSKAEKRAVELVEEFDISQPPVPVEAIARRLDARLTYEAFEGDVSGMLYREDDHAIIGVNSRNAPTRQRFTIAHEIGHLILHRGQPVFVDRFVLVNWRAGGSGREEREANAFAAELLMPRTLIETEIDRALSRRGSITPNQLVAELSRRFQVSAEAMSYRLSNLGVLDPYLLTG
jgi:Zn-dependent peptidase ImmA (M78 family)